MTLPTGAGATSPTAFRVRPAFGTGHLLIELCGDHRAPGDPAVIPDVARALVAGGGFVRADDPHARPDGAS